MADIDLDHSHLAKDRFRGAACGIAERKSTGP
jgi:hypothetical protein